MKGTFRVWGTWETTPGKPARTAVILAGAIAAEAWLATLLWAAAIILAILLIAAVAGVVLLRRAASGEAEALARQAEAFRSAAKPQVTTPARPEVHNHLHLHLPPGTSTAGQLPAGHEAAEEQP